MRKEFKKFFALLLTLSLCLPANIMAEDTDSAESQAIDTAAEGTDETQSQDEQTENTSDDETAPVEDQQDPEADSAVITSEPVQTDSEEDGNIEMEEDEILETTSGIVTLDVSLEYNDYYSFSDYLDEQGYDGYQYEGQKDTEITSCQVKAGTNTQKSDSEVIHMLNVSNYDAVASGTGTTTLVYRKVKADSSVSVPSTASPDNADASAAKTSEVDVEVTVTPATLTLMMLAGQSNMEGVCGTNASEQKEESVICKEGSVFSTYLPRTSNDPISGITYSNVVWDDTDVSDFVAGNLNYCSKNINKGTLEYPIDALTESGSGKSGPDSGLAYTWNQLTGDKVWVANVAWGGTSVASWTEGGTSAVRAIAALDLVEQTYQAEISAGHYTEGNTFLYWYQGEHDKSKTGSYYYSKFKKVVQLFNNRYNPAIFGIIVARNCLGSPWNEEDIELTGARAVQYGVSNSSSSVYSNVYLISNEHEQWVSDQGVTAYFSSRYPGGKLTYPIRDGNTALPTTVYQVHPTIHYDQKGHNENGINAAENTYHLLNGESSLQSIEFRNTQGKAISKISIPVGSSVMVAAVCEPSYCQKASNVKIEDKSIATYNPLTGTLTGIQEGQTRITAGPDGAYSLTVNVVASSDYSDTAGSSYNGLYYVRADSTYVYLKKGIVDTSFTGACEYKGNIYLVKNGIYYKDFTGLYKYNDNWWYFSAGQMDCTYYGIVKHGSSWYRIIDGRYDKSFTGPYLYNSKWIYIKRGKWDRSFSGTIPYNNMNWTFQKGILVG